MFAALFVAGQVAAQTPAPPVTAEQALDTAKEAYGPPDTRAKRLCPPQKAGGEIVVCAATPTDPASAGFDKRRAEADYAAKTADKGAPRAPDLEHKYPGPVVARGCFIPPCPPPMPPIIDLKAIPEAPPGSDADRVGQGLAPTGRDENAAPAPAPMPPG